MIFRKLISSLAIQNSSQDDARRAEVYRSIIRNEAQVGGQLFGPVKKGDRREFFCLDAHTWVWHEEWTDEHGVRHVVTTRYDVRPNGVLKAQDDQQYQYITPTEAQRLFQAVSVYNSKVDAALYGLAA